MQKVVEDEVGSGSKVNVVSGVSVGERTGLTLDSRPDGPDALTSADGSLGRLVLPIGMAADAEGMIYLLGQKCPGVRRFDPDKCAFIQLAGVGDEFGNEVGRLCEQFSDPARPVPSNIAVTSNNLYVADRGNRRVQVFALGTGAVRHVWGPRDAEGRRTTAQNQRTWKPVDVSAQSGRAYILDRRYSRVYLHRAGTDRLKLLIQGPISGNRWSRIVLDKEERIYLLNRESSQAQLEIYDRQGRYVETRTKAGEIRDRFDVPQIRLRCLDPNGQWVFPLPEVLKQLCDKCAAARKLLAFARPCDDRAAAPSAEKPVTAAVSGELVFDREGKRWYGNPEQHSGPKFFVQRGEWNSEALDSKTYRCQWHRIELDLDQLPAGTRVEVRTYADPVDLAPDEAMQRVSKLGRLAYRVAGQLEPPPRSIGIRTGAANQGRQRRCGTERSDEARDAGTGAGPDSGNRHEFLIQSREGQYLWIRILLFGDGYDTPVVRSLRVHYPRSSYVEYLPAVYSADDESRWFLERFLSIFQTEWDGLESGIRDAAALFDPKAVPAGKALEYLAGWFALPLEGTWNSEQKRRLLKAIAGIYFGCWRASSDKTLCLKEVNPAQAARRGTPEGLRRYLQIYLQNITGCSVEEQGDFPQIDEGFRERQRLMLALGDTSALSHCAPLWSPSAVGRLQFGEFARAGEARLVSTGDPEHEIFQEFAHRFRVFVPSAWVRTAKDEEMIHRALREEKPAHTSYELCLVEPRFRIGLQSTVGIDTILGAWPTARLACVHDTTVPPSRLPRHVLGLDTILAAPPADQPTMQVGPKTRAGIDTLLN